MEKKKYTAAIFEYKKLLSCEDAKHTERVLYGNIYHNLATAYVQLFLFDIAADLYLEALNRQEKRSNENSSIGVILCTSKNDAAVEFVMSRTTSPTLVSTYKTKLTNKEALEKKLIEYRKLLEK